MRDEGGGRAPGSRPLDTVPVDAGPLDSHPLDAGPVDTGPLSPQQRQIWLADQNAPPTGLYNEGCLLRLSGTLRPEHLHRALVALVGRHQALRTTFPLQDGEPVQAVWPAPAAARYADPWGDDLVDLSHVPPDVRLERVLGLARQRTEAAFDTARGPLLRWTLVRLGPDDHALVLAVHHLVCDGWSLRLLLRELVEWYAASARGAVPPPLPDAPSYLAYARRQHLLGATAWQDELDRRADALAGAPTLAELPADRLRPAVKDFRGRRDAFPMNEETRQALTRLAAGCGGSRLAVLAAMSGALVYRCTGRGDLLLGTATDPRPERFSRTVGLFANLVPVRLRPDGGSTVDRLLDAACDAVFDAIDAGAVPLEALAAALRPAYDPSHPPLVQLVCTIWDRDYAHLSCADLDWDVLEVPRTRARFDLMMEHVFDAGAWTVHVEYDTGLFGPDTVARFVAHLARLIRGAASAPGQPLASVAMLPPPEVSTALAADEVVLDRDGNVLPVGACGELHRLVAGPDGRPAPTPAGRTARRLPDGRVETLGPLRRRIRLGQLDVQLDQLEDVLRGLPAVRDAALTAPHGEDPRPVAYVVTETTAGAADLAGLRRDLAAALPRMWGPSEVTVLAQIPRRPDGTVDEARLPATPRGTAGPPPYTGLERTLTDVWSLLLPGRTVGPHDDFFALGGGSMAAAQLAVRLTEALGVPVGVRDVFLHPTVHDLAAALTARLRDRTQDVAGAAPTAPAGQRPDREPALSAAQQQIWVNERLMLGAADDFNSAFAHRIRGPLDAVALHRALQRTIDRHPGLRARFEAVDDIPRQHFCDTATVAMPLLSVEDLPAAERAAQAVRLARIDAGTRFETGTAPLVRATLIRLGAEDHLLSCTLHHLVTDGTSMGVVHHDLGEFYAAQLTGREPVPAPVGAHYADYVRWERAWLAGERGAAATAFWRRNLAGAAELRLPIAPGRKRATLSVASCRRTVPAPVVRRLAGLARRCRATVFMAVTAALTTVLARWSGQRDIVLGTLVDNRPTAEVQGTVGCFAGFVPLRVDHDPELAFPDLLARTRDVCLDAYQHQHLPLADIVRAAGARRSFDRMPLFQATVQQVRPELQALSLAGCRTEPAKVTADVSRFELTLFVQETAGGLVLDLEYATDLWDEDTVRARLDRLVTVLDAGSRSDR
ncbi:condensation domain-containing protein [Streptomyces sp. NBC_00669]|uniref:condensation domain-containing protein n=1 Tax=Streptomyces sp. NBC_00669 TaxID=2976011 RepID=UPI002E3082CC|nr:condensation domain-containing protein [Streptomyces sp. NBC_00669]